jgi:hypothetical protein
MDAMSCPPKSPRPVESPARRGVACPFCDGMLVPLRGEFRCLRCCFSICPGCEDVDRFSCGGPAD